MKILNYNLDNYQALLFDLDGTLLNSMPLHNRAWLDTLSEFGAPMPESFLWETAGMSSLRIVEIVNQKKNLNLDPKTVARAKRDRYLKTMHQVEVVAPVQEILEHYKGVRPLGVITGGSHEVVDVLLPKLNLDHYFDSIICSDDTDEGKDSVAPYELAGKQLSVDPSQCIFLDDGDVGLRGAKLAGMDVIHVDIAKPEIFIK